MSSPAEMRQISEQIGRLTGEVIGIKDLIVAHQSEADRRWDRIDEDQLKLDIKTNTLSDRIGKLEKLANRFTAIMSFIVFAGGLIGWLVAQYGSAIIGWIRGKP